MRRRVDEDGGAVLVIAAAAIFALFAIAAIVLDLAQIRNDRVANRSRADAAAAAGVLTLDQANPRDACDTAIDYLELNTNVAGGFSGINCNFLPLNCDDLTPARETVGSNGRFTVLVQYPVPDDSRFMNPSVVGNTGQTIHADDGHQCERLAVEVEADHDTFFARVMGVNSQSSRVHAVAKPGRSEGIRTVNLLILERHRCQAVNISSSSGGGVFLGDVFDPVSGRSTPGYMAVDSDGTVGCGSRGTLDLSGSGAQLIADGPPGCPSEISPPPGRGCGLIELFAAVAPGCALPACSSGGTLAPLPEPLKERVTRAPVDHRYNCKPNYPIALDIAGCRKAPDPRMDNLRAAYGGSSQPAGFQSYTTAGRPCNVGGVEIVPPGNWYVDCNLSITGTLVFTGGDVVFAGNVSVSSNGIIAVNATHPGLVAGINPAIAYFQNGTLSKSGQGSIQFLNTMVYFSATSINSFSGGSGAVVWTAPTSGPFDDLALWSDSTADHKFAGSAVLQLEGLYFVPVGNVDYRGNGFQNQVAAQFISKTLSVGGNGRLVLKPDLTRSVLLPAAAVMLIR